MLESDATGPGIVGKRRQEISRSPLLRAPRGTIVGTPDPGARSTRALLVRLDGLTSLTQALLCLVTASGTPATDTGPRPVRQLSYQSHWGNQLCVTTTMHLSKGQVCNGECSHLRTRPTSRPRLVVARAITNSAGSAAQHSLNQAAIAAGEAVSSCPFTKLKTQLGLSPQTAPVKSTAEVPGPEPFRFVARANIHWRTALKAVSAAGARKERGYIRV